MPWDTEPPQKTAPATPNPRRVRCKLRNVRDVSAELAKVYREARSGILPVEHASRLANVLALLGRTLEATALEDRVAALEARG